MDLKHSFTVPASVDETWAAFGDIASVAGCFPGAQVTSVEGDSFEGTCKVKLGPIALVYKGSGSFVEKDEAAHRMVIEAKGKDKRGNGTAGAHVTAQLAEVADGTEVTVDTDLAITGKPAQFGRGVMQDVSDKLLGIFVECLRGRLGEGAAPTNQAADEAAPAASSTPAAPTDAPAEPAAQAAAPPDPPAPSPPIVSSPSAPRTPAGREPEVEALDLGSTVLPVLVKAYWKPAVAVLAVIAVVVVVVVAL